MLRGKGAGDSSVESSGLARKKGVDKGSKGRFLWPGVAVAALLLISVLGADSLLIAVSAANGNGWAWGRNSSGQLGDGSSAAYRNTPVAIGSLDSIVFVAAGGSHSMALRSDGTVWSWGSNERGQLGDGNYGVGANSSTPVQVRVEGDHTAISGVTAISAGQNHSLALMADGTVWAWGANDYGQLGDGTTSDSLYAKQLPGLEYVVAIAAGSRHSLALDRLGNLWAWGYNAEGQLGIGPTLTPTPTNTSTPVPTPTGTYTATNTPTPTSTSTSLPTNTPQLTPIVTPVSISVLPGVVAIGAGWNHSVAVRSDAVWSWGANNYGQLGDGTQLRRDTPVQVKVGGGTITNASAVAAGENHSLVLKTDGTVWAWGRNSSGQLGDGTTFDRANPVRVQGLTQVIAVAAGQYHSLAVKSDGTVWAWGDNFYGKLGDGTQTKRTSPVRVQGFPTGVAVAGIAAGADHSLAVQGTPSPTGTPTSTATITPTSTITSTPTATATGTITPLPTDTPTVTATPTITTTPEPSSTPAPTTTPTATRAVYTATPTFVPAGPPPPPEPPSPRVRSNIDSRFFVQTGYRVDHEALWGYFRHRGGVRTFGYPVSRTFTLLGTRVQLFQRGVLQVQPDGGVTVMNLLDSGMMPYTRVNSSTFPAPDLELIQSAPSLDSPDYAERAIAFVLHNTPDVWNGIPVGFRRQFMNTVTFRDAFPEGNGNAGLLSLMNLELLGMPTSKPQWDPNNRNFVYQRFQRGMLHYDVSTGQTQGLLLGDYFKSVLTGRGLPPDLEQQASTSRFYKQYNPTRPGWVDRPEELPNTKLEGAFEPEGSG